MQEILEALPDADVRALAVWEPVILTDIAPPTSGALALLPDRRVTQLWDPDRRLSRALYPMLLEMYREEAGGADEPAPEEPEVVWDFVAWYPGGGRWEGAPPQPAFTGYPIIDAAGHLRETLTRAARGSRGDATAASPAPPPPPPGARLSP